MVTGRRVSIAAVAIAKNEEDRIHAWCANLGEADGMFIYDTGSEDGTVDCARSEGITVWKNVAGAGEFRFDRARNDLLLMVRNVAPFDYVFWVDLDETVEPGWRAKFEMALMQYGQQEVFSTVRFWGGLAYDRATIHKFTLDWSWRRPVHEELIFRDREEYSPAPTGIRVDHDQDPSKDRSQYLPLMKIACDEDPEDTQIAFWYARELMYHRDYRKALGRFRLFVDMKDAWVIEKMQAYLHMAEIYKTLSPHTVMERRAIQDAIDIAPWRREPLLAMARYYSVLKDARMDEYAAKALSIPHTMRPQDYLSAESTWNDELIRKELIDG
jgi:glycosyltransferase involved in cell wall biosynthesis